jgi:mannosylglycerate hydrolase
LVVRIYNPTNRETTGKIKLGVNIHKVYLGRLDESYEKELLYKNGVEIELKPKEIKTIIFEIL